MIFSDYESPIGKILLFSDSKSLCALYFESSKFCPDTKNITLSADKITTCAKRWLNIYFSGQEPDFMPSIKIEGTPFQREIWEILMTVPYGSTMTYGQIAKLIAKKHSSKMSAQAVGAAVGRNKISLIIPCHRVIGASGELVGYAGGTDKKEALLKLESKQS